MAGQLLAKKEKDCVKIAKDAVIEMKEGKTKDASANLQTLQTAGKELAEHAEKLTKRLKKVQNYNKKKRGGYPTTNWSV